MLNWLLENEAGVRLASFLGIFLIVGVWELLLPRRRRELSRWVRWPSNLALMAVNTVILRLVFPVLAVGVATYVQSQKFGLLQQVAWPGWLKILLAIVFMDFIIYLQHVVFHMVPVFWRLHRMHHVDVDLDVTSGARFHSIEMVLSMLIKMATIWLLGPDPAAVVIFEIILNGMAMFNHGNIYMPEKMDRALRFLIVTPDMHRVHHSVHMDETNSNYGFNLALWDRLLGTYLPAPRDGQEQMHIGLTEFRDRRFSYLHYLLAIPFLRGRSS